MKSCFVVCVLLHFITIPATSQVKSGTQFTDNKVYRFDVETAKIADQSPKTIADQRLSNNKDIVLKPGIPAAIDRGRAKPDINFNV